MKRTEILQEAARLVGDEREGQHGSPEEGFRRVAMVWSAILGQPVSPQQVPLCMAGLKLVRAGQGAFNTDDFVDGSGYFALAGETSAKTQESGK